MTDLTAQYLKEVTTRLERLAVPGGPIDDAIAVITDSLEAGGVVQALGAALFEEMVIDGEGHVTNPTFRTYHIPAYADIPRTEVLFAKTIDPLGPFGAKSMSESPYNPVAAALGNAIRDATGVRLYRLPFKPDRIHAALSAAATD